LDYPLNFHTEKNWLRSMGVDLTKPSKDSHDNTVLTVKQIMSDHFWIKIHYLARRLHTFQS